MSAYGHDDLDADEGAEIDRAYQRDLDDPRADAGYAPHPTLEPRSVKPAPGAGHWGVVWIPGEPTTENGRGDRVAAPVKHCAKCKEPASVLVQDPRDYDRPSQIGLPRTICPRCQGELNADRMYGGGGRR